MSRRALITYGENMEWKRKGASADSSSVELVTMDGGVLVQGSPTAVTAVVDQMLETTAQAGRRSRLHFADALMGVATTVAFRQSHREYIEFSGRARALLTQRGVIPTDDGYYRSFVRLGGQFAGNLDWKPVSLVPEQALVLQTAVAQLALRAAIRDVVTAIERVEGKVDRLVELARAERLGAAQGDYLTLRPLVEQARSRGEISRTDWSTVAALGPLISRDIESLRVYVHRQLKDVKRSPLARIRAGAAEELADELLKESVALLVLVEQNYAWWQALRLAHAATHEPAVLQRTGGDIRHQLAVLTAADQRLLNALNEAIGLLLAPTGFEGFAPLQKRRLCEYGLELAEVAAWFSDQRHLDLEIGEPAEYPDLIESLEKAGRTIAIGAGVTTKVIAERMEDVFRRRRAGGDGIPALLRSGENVDRSEERETESDVRSREGAGPTW